MAFEPLKNDYVFKEVFSNERILRRFISDVTGVPFERIKSVRVVNPFLRKRYRYQKLGILDIALVLNDKVRIDIELQLRPQTFWEERSIFYLTKMYTEALRVGEDYSKLRKCIAIDIVDFTMVKSLENHSVYSLRNAKGEEFKNLLELHVIELNKTLQGDDPLGEWIRLFNAETKEKLEKLAESARIAEVKEAVGMVETMNLTRSLRWIFEQQLKAKRDRWAEDEYVKEQGRAEGRAEGVAEGRAKGMAEGRIEAKAEAVLQLLARLGAVPSDLQDEIMQQRDPEILGEWHLVAADAKSVQEFRDKFEL